MTPRSSVRVPELEDLACPSVLRVAPATPKKRTWCVRRDYSMEQVGPPEVMPPTRSDSPDLPTSERRRVHGGGGKQTASSQRTRTTSSPPRDHRDHRTRRSTSLSAPNRMSTPLCISDGTPDGSPLNLIAFRSVDTFPSPSASLGTQSYFPNGWFTSQFRTIGDLGRGNFGHVVLAQNTLDQMPYAIKILDTVIRSNRELTRRIDEGKVLARCCSSYVVRYFSCWVEEKRLYLQCEYCPGGTLAERISHFQTQGIKWLESAVVSLLLQMTLALYHLHVEVQVAHLDLKPGNIFIGGDGKYKLGDFGHAHFLKEEENGKLSKPFAAGLQRSRERTTNTSMDSFVSLGDMRLSLEEGDIRYLPLEMLNDKTCLVEADIFALGVTLYEVATGQQLPKGDAQWLSLREKGINRSAVQQNIKIDCTNALQERLRRGLRASLQDPFQLGVEEDPLISVPGLAEAGEGDSLLVGIIGKMMDKDPKARPTPRDLLTQYRPLFSSRSRYGFLVREFKGDSVCPGGDNAGQHFKNVSWDGLWFFFVISSGWNWHRTWGQSEGVSASTTTVFFSLFSVSPDKCWDLRGGN